MVGNESQASLSKKLAASKHGAVESAGMLDEGAMKSCRFNALLSLGRTVQGPATDTKTLRFQDPQILSSCSIERMPAICLYPAYRLATLPCRDYP